jgi:hypothetical protein
MEQAVSVEVSARAKIHLSVRHHRRVKLNAIFGDSATVGPLFCIVKLVERFVASKAWSTPL